MQPHDFWQAIESADEDAPAAVFAEAYPARLPDGRILRLPIRPRGEGETALASLIVNQASFSVQETLAAELARQAEAYAPDIVVGLPTLGLTLAAAVARALGHPRYVPLGTSRKFWYEDRLSFPLTSITTPDRTRHLYIDPRMLPLIAGRRVLLVDDVISSGTSMAAGIELMGRCGVQPVALGAAMLQSDRWRQRLADLDPCWPERTLAVFSTPLLRRALQGWVTE
ncbi:phosphoribosyltransferase [Consotaella aegiceratis]|uniref:phosphoribosyltransferase n=1 Tax=Consotaella aegiceratis TaxID=3097961 RepID=UPI002F3EBA3C